MIKFLLALFISTASFAAQPGAVPSVTVAASGLNSASMTIVPGQLTANCGGAGSSGCFSLYCPASTTGTGQFFPCYVNGVAYKVGNVLGTGTPKAYCFDITGGSASGSQLFQLASATSAITANASSITGTPLYQGGAAGSYPSVTTLTGGSNGVVPGTYTFSNAYYAGLQVAANITIQVHMDCFEQ
jgi:hypothetical protein